MYTPLRMEPMLNSCHRLMTTMVPMPMAAPIHLLSRLPLTTTKMCSRIQSLRVTCHFRQNWVKLAAERGFLKFSGTTKPVKAATEMAISL